MGDIEIEDYDPFAQSVSEVNRYGQRLEEIADFDSFE